jgi:hypothetical protein
MPRKAGGFGLCLLLRVAATLDGRLYFVRPVWNRFSTFIGHCEPTKQLSLTSRNTYLAVYT